MAKERKISPAVRREVLPGSAVCVFPSQDYTAFLMLCLNFHLSIYICTYSLLSCSRAEWDFLLLSFPPPCHASLTSQFHECFHFAASTSQYCLPGCKVLNHTWLFIIGNRGSKTRQEFMTNLLTLPALVTLGLPLHPEHTSSSLYF